MKKLTTIILNELKEFNHFFKEQEIPAKTILLHEGQISKTMFFIEKGCLRTWINNDGKEITTQFFFEGDGVSSIESFRTNQPSLYSIESLEPCILKTLSQKDFQIVLESSPELRKKLEDHLFRRLFQSQQLLYSFLKNKPKKTIRRVNKTTSSYYSASSATLYCFLFRHYTCFTKQNTKQTIKLISLQLLSFNPFTTSQLCTKYKQ